MEGLYGFEFLAPIIVIRLLSTNYFFGPSCDTTEFRIGIFVFLLPEPDFFLSSLCNALRLSLEGFVT